MGKDPQETGLQFDDNYMPTMGAFLVHWLLCKEREYAWDGRADSFCVVLTEWKLL